MRNITDADLIKSIALAAAGASSVTASIDLGAAAPAVIETIELEASLPILPILVDTKTVIVTFQDSADNSSFAAIAALGTLTATGTETPGTAAALALKVKLPSTVRRYVRLSAAVLAAAGDNTNQSVTMTLYT